MALSQEARAGCSGGRGALADGLMQGSGLHLCQTGSKPRLLREDRRFLSFDAARREPNALSLPSIRVAAILDRWMVARLLHVCPCFSPSRLSHVRLQRQTHQAVTALAISHNLARSVRRWTRATLKHQRKRGHGRRPPTSLTNRSEVERLHLAVDQELDLR